MPPGCRFSGNHRTQLSPRLALQLIDRYHWIGLAPVLGLAATLLTAACHDVGGPMPSAIGAPNFSLGGGPGVWTTKASMPTARYGLGVGVVNSVLYAVGGAGPGGNWTAVEAYDPATNIWTTKASMPTGRIYMAVGVVNGIVYALGGQNYSNLATVEAYDPATNTWTTKASMPTVRYGLAVGVVNGILYAVGGQNGSLLATVEAYNPATNTWTTKASMPTARDGLGVGVVNSILYAVGGAGPNQLATVEAYDPATNTWTTKASMPTTRYGLTLGVVNGILYAVGGCCGGATTVATVEAYDPAINTWTTKASMPTARSWLASGVVNGILHAVGGTVTGIPLATVEAYQPPPATNHFVSPTGTSAGDGSIDNPWDLQTGLDGAGGRILAGDTVWLRGGEYTGTTFRAFSTFHGNPGVPVVLRERRGEHATINGRLRVDGTDLLFWGFEIKRSNLSGNDTLSGIEILGARSKAINLIIHDASGQGIQLWNDADGGEVYGSIVYNNGTTKNKDHGIYVHSPMGTRRVEDNVFFQNHANGVHAYADSSTNSGTNPPQMGITVVGNVSFNNGTINSQNVAPKYGAKTNILVGGQVPYSGIRVDSNLVYYNTSLADSAGISLRVGDDTVSVQNVDAVVRGNYARGGWVVFQVAKWSQATVDNNTFANTTRSSPITRVVHTTGSVPLPYSWTSNTHFRDPTVSNAWRHGATGFTFAGWKQNTGLGATDVANGTNPGTAKVFVRPNRYERGRGHVIVFNWPGTTGSVPVALSSILAVGDNYEVRNVQQLICQPGLCAPIVSGTYGGGTVNFPMTGVPAPAPVPYSTRRNPPYASTAPNFDVFLVTCTSCQN
jgi:hypothetical protein